MEKQEDKSSTKMSESSVEVEDEEFKKKSN
jgi:hypothetical protein